MANILDLLKLISLGLAASNNYAENPSVQLFQEYLRMNTTTHHDLTPAVQFWETLASSMDLTMNTYYYKEGYPVIVIKWPGTNPELPSVMLNSHMDVVPANDADWQYPPFSATITPDGEIWGRGTQDTKSVSIQYFLALKALKEENVTQLRDIYITLMPDEEVGGPAGMIPFTNSETFEKMNVGVELDEGGAGLYPAMPIFYEDKAVWQIEVTCWGEAGHSLTFPASNTTSFGKCRNVIDRVMNFRDEEYEKSLIATEFNGGEYTSVSLNGLTGGTANNVIPGTITLVFDIRLATKVNATAFEAQLNSWMEESGPNITMKFLQKDQQSARVVIDNTNPYYVAMQEAALKLGITIVPFVTTGATDARFVRLKGVSAFGFAPMPNTPSLPHTNQERLNAETFLKGIDYYKVIIQELANIPAESTDGLDKDKLVIQAKN